MVLLIDRAVCRSAQDDTTFMIGHTGKGMFALSFRIVTVVRWARRRCFCVDVVSQIHRYVAEWEVQCTLDGQYLPEWSGSDPFGSKL